MLIRRKRLSILLAIALVICSFPISAFAVDPSNTFSALHEATTVSINGGTISKVNEINVPSEYGTDKYPQSYAYEVQLEDIEIDGTFHVAFSFGDGLKANNSNWGSFPKVSTVGYSLADMTPYEEGTGDDPVVPIGGDDDPVVPIDGNDDPVVIGDDDPVVIGDDDPVVIGDDDPVVIGDDDPVVIGDDDPVVIGDDDPVVIGDDDPVVIGDDDPVVIGDDDPVVIGDDDPVVIGDDDPVVIGDDDPVVIGDDDPVVIGDDDPVVIGDDDPVVIGDDDPVVIGDDDPVVIGDDDPVVIGDDNPVVIGDDDPVVIGDDDPVVIGDDDPVVIGDDDPVVIGDDDPVVIGDDDPVVIGDDDPVVIGDDDPVVIGDDDPVVIGDDDPVVIGDDDPVVIGDDDPVVIGDDDPVVIGDDDPVVNGIACCVPEETVQAILSSSTYEYDVKLLDGKATLVVYFYFAQNSGVSFIGGRLVVIPGNAPWESGDWQTPGTVAIFNFELSNDEPLQSVNPAMGQIDIEKDLFEGNRTTYLVLPKGTDSTVADFTVKDPSYTVIVNNESVIAPDQTGHFEASLHAAETTDGKTGGYENHISVYQGDTLLRSYTIIGVNQRYEGLPDSVVDFLCIGSQYTNIREEAEYGLRAVRSLVGSNFDAGGILTGPVSLGNFGGYITYYYKDAIVDDPNNPYGIDFITFGNSVEGSNEFAEPGQVWVSEDGSTWYALAGSLHYENTTDWNAELTYRKASDGNTINIKQDGSTRESSYQFPDPELYTLHDFGDDPDADITVRGIGIGAEEGSVRPLFPEFGYTDVGNKGMNNDSNNTADNPYVGSYEKIGRVFLSGTDGMDLAWAVDSNGQPVAFPNGIHYVKIVCANNINAGAIGEKSTEVNMVRVAKANDSAVGVSTAPTSISFDGMAVDLSAGTQISDNVFSFTGTNAIEVRGAFEVVVDAGESNVFINNNKNNSVAYDAVPNHGIVRVIVQDGEKEPLIYVFSLDPKEASQEETDREAAEAVDRLIEAIGDVTLEKKDAIEKAQAAYEALTDAQKELVTKKAVLDAAVAALAELLAQDFGTVHVIVENDTFTQATAAELGVEWKDDIYWSGVLVEEDVALTADSSMIGVVAQALAAKGFTQTGADTGYISEIHGLGEKDAGPDSGWMGMLNDWFTNQGFDAFTVANGRLGSGDEIHVVYSVTGLATENNDTSLAGLSASVGEFDKAFDLETLTYTLTVPAGTTEIQLTPTAANKNFYVTIKSGDTEYKRTESVPVADGTVIKLTVGAPTMNTNFTPTTYQVIIAVEGIEAVERVENLIDAIGEVTTDSGDAILAARTAYDALTEDEKVLVSNYDKLVAAEAAYDAIVKAAVKAVEDMIDALPDDVTLADKEAIEAAREAYEALTDEQKALVENYEDLIVAEKALEKLQNARIEDIYKNTGDYIEALIKEKGLTVNPIGGEWAVIGLARGGREVPDLDKYLEKVDEFIAENINDSEQLHRALSTDNSRLILALTALGKDVSDTNGHDLVAGLSDLSFVKKQGINGPIWALIALDAHAYEPAEGATATRDALIEEILAAQLTDGGWVLSSTATSADGDMTGMALQALAPYYKTNDKVKAAVDKALDCLSDMQNAVGGFGSLQGGGATLESSAQVIVALTALGIDPAADERFVKNGLSVLDDLCSYYVEGGGFEHVEGGGLDGMATEQGYYALAAYFRFKDGQTSLYDMSDVEIEKSEEPADSRGDINGDSQISADDLTQLSRYIAQIEQIPEDAAVRKACDVDGDGTISADDLTLLSRLVAHIISELPAPIDQ